MLEYSLQAAEARWSVDSNLATRRSKHQML